MKSMVAFALPLALVFGTAIADEKKDVKGAEKGRDWTLIDTNKDHYIQPEEMAKWLEANPGPAAVKK